MASRVVKAAAIGRAVTAGEDVHHVCGTRHCVEPTHLVVTTVAEHQAHHAAQQRKTLCPRHGTPYEQGRYKHCRKCAAEATARHRQRHGRKPMTEAQRLRRNERIRALRATAEGGGENEGTGDGHQAAQGGAARGGLNYPAVPPI